MIKRLEYLYIEIDNLLNIAPSVEDCSDKENDMYSDMANLKDSLFNYLTEGR